MFTLVYTLNGETERRPLPPGETVVGRAPGCQIIVDDASISRRHARFTVTGDRCVLADLGSRNGVYCNGDLITETEVSDTDALLLGRVPVELARSYENELVLSEDHAIIEEGTIYRPLPTDGTLYRAFTGAAEGAPGTSVKAPPDAIRLLEIVEILSDISRTLARTHAVGDVLERVVQLAFDNIAAERVFVLLTDPRSGEPVPRLSRMRDGSTPERASISRTIVRTVMTDRVAMLAADARLDPRLNAAESILAYDIRSFVCAPLWNGDAVIGVLYADTSRSRQFSASDLDLFAALSNAAAVAIEQARLGDRLLEETRRRERLQRYHSPAVVDRILAADAESDTAFIAQERDLTVLFLDIVGFTSFSEPLAPAQVARTLNSFFSRMTEVIFRHEGTLDKFIGDAILAVFGAPLDQPDHASRAVRAALDMRRALDAFNAERPDSPLNIRIALASGRALVGDIGSPCRREFTVLGDTVNTASRLESSIAGPGQIVMTRATYDRVRDDVAARSLGSFTLRGRTQEVEVFEVETAAVVVRSA